MYKVLSSLTTPICGLNLVLLLGYMSSGLLMFGLVKWLLKRFDIALFAGYAAAFVPFHIFKGQSHINYTYGKCVHRIGLGLSLVPEPSKL